MPSRTGRAMTLGSPPVRPGFAACWAVSKSILRDGWNPYGVWDGCRSDSVAGQAMNRYRGTQAEFQFSMVLPHTAHSKLLISRDSTMCSLRS
jgi:hypothetical protein